MYLKTMATLALLASAGFASAESISPQQVSFTDGAVPQSLTGEPGNPAEGREVFANRKLGNCLACHANEDLAEQAFHGQIGPMLDGVGDRWSEAELRAIVVNAKEVFEGTIMPAFYNARPINRPLKGFEDKTILSAQQVEDLVAYLMLLKE